MGTPHFATESLNALISSGANVVGVITAPDKPSGRGQKLTQSPVKICALKHGLTILQPEKLKDTGFLEDLRALNADLQIVVAFRMLPEVVWDMPPLGTINLHASLLPNYRGAAPINRAVMNGETKTGVTTFFLKHAIDTGNIILQEEVPILPDDTAGTLHDKLMVKGAALVVKTVKAIAAGEVHEQPQPEEALHHAPKIYKEDCRINWNESQERIHNLIRGLSPYPTAWSTLVMPEKEPVMVKIFASEKVHELSQQQPGKIKIVNNKLQVGTASGDLLITELQMAGKKRMKTADFLKGFRIIAGMKFM